MTNKGINYYREWMAPRIFSFDKDHFKEIKTNLSNKYGWWQSDYYRY